MPYLEVNKQAVAKILQNPVASQEPKSSCFPEEERQRRLTIAQDHLEQVSVMLPLSQQEGTM